MEPIKETWERFAATVLVEWTPEQLDIARAIFCSGATIGACNVEIESIETLLKEKLAAGIEELNVVDTANTIKDCRVAVTDAINELNGSETEHEPPRIITLN